MARTPSMTTQEAEAILGPRVGFTINGDNRPTVKKWLCAMGYNAAFIAGLSGIELQNAYRGQAGIDAVGRKWRKAKDDAGGDLLGLDLDPEQQAALDQVKIANDKIRASISLAQSGPRQSLTVATLAAGASLTVRAGWTALPDQNAPAPTPALPAPVPTSSAQGDIAATLRELILGGWTPPTSLDEAKVRSIVQEEVHGIEPKVIHIKHQDREEPIKLDGLVHVMFERVLKLLTTTGAHGFRTNVYLVGPAGCGKTTLAKQLAKAMDIKSTIIACNTGTTEGDVIGRLLPVDDGNFRYIPSEFIKLYETGNALIVFDEMDKLDANMAAVVNMPLDNGAAYVHLRHDNPMVVRGPNVSFIGTGNTFGTGADPLYVSSNAQDEATRDRFTFVSVDYDKRLEESIGHAGGLTAAEMASLWELRDRTREARLHRTISTRAFYKASVLKACGDCGARSGTSC